MHGKMKDMKREPKQQPAPVLQLRFYREDGTVVEAEVPGPLVTMPAKRPRHEK